MNGSEQRNHKTAVTILERRTADFADAVMARLAAQEVAWRDAIAAESRRRNELASEQRGYVDARDRELSQQIEGATAIALQHTVDATAILRRGFWSRLNWLLTGR